MAMADQGGQNTAGVTEIETRTFRQAPVAHFVSGLGLGLGESEQKVVWEIRNFSHVLKMSNEALKDNGITFEAGHSIGIPATWNFYFVQFSDWLASSKTRMLYHLALSSNSKATIVKASYSITLSCGGKTIVAHDLNVHEFKNPGGGGACKSFPKEDVLVATKDGEKALKVTLIIKVVSDERSKSVAMMKTLTGKKGDLISDFKKLLESGTGADFEIRVPKEVGGELDETSSSYTKKAHKSILMARSPVFSKMFANDNDGEVVDAKGEVVIKDLSPKGLDIFLHYLYTGKVLKDWVQVPEEIVNVAENYGCGRLKQYCGQNLISAVSTKNALTLYKVAEIHKLSVAKSAIAEFIHNNTRAVLGADDDVPEESKESGDQEEEEIMGDDA